jgi:conjugative transfer signal peptidase TraF
MLWAGLFSSAFAAIAALSPRPWLIWNASASAPVGLYRIDHDAPVTLGQLVAIRPSPEIARFLEGRRYLASGVPLMKDVAALPGQQVCRVGVVVTVDARPMAVAKLQDRMGRALPVWRGCHRVSVGEIFLLNPTPDSLDGRYFGALPAAGLIGTAHPILTRNASGAPLRWRVPDRLTALPTTSQENTP